MAEVKYYVEIDAPDKQAIQNARQNINAKYQEIEESINKYTEDTSQDNITSGLKGRLKRKMNRGFNKLARARNIDPAGVDIQLMSTFEWLDDTRAQVTLAAPIGAVKPMLKRIAKGFNKIDNVAVRKVD